MFPPQGLVERERLLLITDELPSPADFVLHQILATQFKEKRCHKCVILAVAEDFDRWKAVAAKSVSSV
jgi:hypothetical protein